MTILYKSTWGLAEGFIREDIFLFRFREPFPEFNVRHTYPFFFTILFPYEKSGNFLPSVNSLSLLSTFETSICHLLEQNNLSILMAVLTFDGARTWIFYASDIQKCKDSISEILINHSDINIEIEGDFDPNWNFLKENFLDVLI